VAHRVLRSVLAALAATACGNAPETSTASRSSADAASPAAGSAAYVVDEAAWGKYHSKRHQFTVSLPEGKVWKIDDHRQPELVATHAATKSRLTVMATREEELANQTRCEARARSLGWVPQTPLTTVEDADFSGPEDYRSRVWVAVDAGRRDGSLEGHVFLFGAFLHRCLLVHLVTGVASANDEEVLATRLAVGTTRIVKGISVDASRTTEDAPLPRDKPDVKR
jgi:hypothetical protein